VNNVSGSCIVTENTKEENSEINFGLFVLLITICVVVLVGFVLALVWLCKK